MLGLALLLACKPGILQAPEGSDTLRTAFWDVQDDQDGDRLTLLLFNSYVPCNLANGDAADIDSDADALDSALLREGARAIWLEILRLPRHPSWEGEVPIYSDDLLFTHIDGQHPFAGQGAFTAVYEATLDQEDGLEQSYTPTEYEVALLGQPSWLEIDRHDMEISGRFSLESVDVAGRFRAERCASLEDHVARARALLLTVATETEDTAE